LQQAVQRYLRLREPFLSLKKPYLVIPLLPGWRWPGQSAFGQRMREIEWGAVFRPSVD
jgi:hypothetical protein